MTHMKQFFSNSGFAQVQAAVFLLTESELEAEMHSLRSHLSEWLNKHFLLTPEQLQQVENLDAQFRQDIADAIADSWTAGIPILFDKQNEVIHRQSEKPKSPKDIILERRKRQSQDVESDEVVEQMEVVVRISYD